MEILHVSCPAKDEQWEWLSSRSQPVKPQHSRWWDLLVLPCLAIIAIQYCIAAFAGVLVAAGIAFAGAALLAGLVSGFAFLLIHWLVSLGPFWLGIMAICYFVSKKF